MRKIFIILYLPVCILLTYCKNRSTDDFESKNITETGMEKRRECTSLDYDSLFALNTYFVGKDINDFEDDNNINFDEVKSVNSTAIKLNEKKLSNLRNLKWLDIQDQNIDNSVLENFYKNNCLQYLNIVYSNLKNLPAGLEKFQHLQYLKLRKNKIQEINEFPDISLIELDLSENIISSFEISGQSLESLSELHLNDNHLKDFPKSILKCENLETLFIGNNPINSIPKEIIKLKNLNYLYLHNIDLKEFPYFLKESTSLETIIFSKYIVDEDLEDSIREDFKPIRIEFVD
ncbi:leucine-rich repeat domain-containing protein [Mangrovivirga cuniculi]|uniref:Leucine-rich repeat domain-containing protein n=1 Tax=Mangrovivirga cuniculi TaxID=2715131 RepID=A0A4D7K616_9BACT|nr:leucine-rich repeat domain-containing protein [Mangrovivirga cuniculi]QCK16234.1 hypothetical protein DCC35_16540 [Mangrovivirga cuniculi]